MSTTNSSLPGGQRAGKSTVMVTREQRKMAASQCKVLTIGADTNISGFTGWAPQSMVDPILASLTDKSSAQDFLHCQLDWVEKNRQGAVLPKVMYALAIPIRCMSERA
jgi:hypothetical protein